MTVTLGTTGIIYSDSSKTITNEEMVHYDGDIFTPGGLFFPSQARITGDTITVDRQVVLYNDPPSSIIVPKFFSSDRSTYRNKTISSFRVNAGFEANTALDINIVSDTTNRYATSVSGTLSWVAGSQNTDFEPFTGFTTFAVNHGVGATPVSTITHNSTNYSANTIFSGTIRTSHALSSVFIPTGYGCLNLNNTVSATFTKSSHNSANVQSLYNIPGKWQHVKNVTYNNTNNSSSPQYISITDVKKGDLLIAFGSYNTTTTSGSTSFFTSTRNMIRRAMSLNNTTGSETIAQALADGTHFFAAQIYSPPSQSGSTMIPESWTLFPSIVSVFRLEDL